MSDAQPAPPPAPVTHAPAEPKASGPLRALAVLVSLALLFGVAVMVIVVINPDNLPLCDEVRSGEAALGPTLECIDSSNTGYTATRVAAAGAALIGGLAALLGFYVGATGRRGSLMVKLTIVAIALAVLAILAGEL